LWTRESWGGRDFFLPKKKNGLQSVKLNRETSEAQSLVPLRRRTEGGV